MKIQKIDSIDFDTLYKVLSSNKITLMEKNDFVRKNRAVIARAVKIKISTTDYKRIMQKRGLRKFRPLKNCFTKRGDKYILAHALNVTPDAVALYINKAKEEIRALNRVDFLSYEKTEMLKTYVYRHGSKDDIVAFLDYELTQAKDLLKTLYSTLQYHSGGVADYFIRPIHRMDNQTLIKVFDVVNKHIENAEKHGVLEDKSSKEIALWALGRIYEIQNNSKLINAIKTYKTLK